MFLSIPNYRSIAISSASPSLVAGSSFEGPKFGGSHAKLPPLNSFGGMKKPLIGIARPGSLGVRNQSAGGLNVKQEWSGASVPSCWDVKGEDLEMVPWEFPLERTHREIKEDASAVSKRISECLRALSVEVEFCSETAKAKCKTTDYVMFRIRLFAGSESGQPVVVEMQRRSGSSSSFMRTCRALLNAAEGNDTLVMKAPFASRGPPAFKRPVSSMKCLASIVPQQQNFEADAADALNGVNDMLKSVQRDSNILGLENLSSLTDPLQTNAAVSLLVSKSIILDDDKYDIREEIRLLMERDVFDKNEGPSTHSDHMRFLSLCVLANAVCVCAQDGSLAVAMKEQRWFADSLFPSLVDELKRANTSMNNAYKAASCLHSMMSSSSGALQPLVDEGFVSVLESVHEVGRVRHELLAIEADLCLKAARSLV